MLTAIMTLRWSVLGEPRNALNALALGFGLAAAILMAYYPPRVEQHTKDGRTIGSWVSGPTQEGQRLGWYQHYISKLAPWLLALAFFLQFIAILLP
jgi:hypothetical protein